MSESESGFEVARAYVAVSPDASDFADALDEQVGGISVSVAIVPDASDFAAAVDDQLGGLSATVAVTPDLTDFADAIAEQTSGLTASVLVTPETGDADFSDALSEQAGGAEIPIAVVPDMSGFIDKLNSELTDLSENVASGYGGAIPVPVLPDTADFADALDEKVGGLTVSVRVVPDISELSDDLATAVADQNVTLHVTPDASDITQQVQDQVDADPPVTLPVEADTTQAVASIEEIGPAAESADSGIETLYNGILSIGPAATQAEMEAVDALGSIREAAATAVPADAITEPFAAIGPAAQSAASEVTSALSDADNGVESFLGGIYRLGPAATEEGSQIADAMGNARQGVADLASAAGSVDYSAATSGLNNVDDAATGLAEDAPAAADASKGLSGVLEELAGRMSYFAVDPFMWMYAAPVVIEGVAAAIKALSDNSENLIYQMGVEDQAGGDNIAGYEKLSQQLSGVSGEQTALKMTTGQVASAFVETHDGLDTYSTNLRAVSAAQQAAQEHGENLSGNLGTLAQKYDLTAGQAVQLQNAAGETGKQLSGSGEAAEAAMAKIEAYANANTSAAGPVGQLAQDAETFGNDALTAADRIGAMEDAYNRLAGNFVAGQQGMLTVQQDFLNIQAGAETAGASMTGVNQQSDALQQAFYATIPAIEQTAQAMVNAKDPTAQVTAYVQDQIDKLSGLTGGSQQASQAVQGLTQYDDNLRSQMDTTSQAILKSAGNLQDSFIKQLEDAGAKSSATKTDVDELTDSIVATGDKSTSTQAARAQLIKDLENAGINAQKATQLVDGFIKAIGNIPSSKTVSIIETATGTITINEATQTATVSGTGSTLHGATGGMVYGGSGHPKADDIHAMLSHGEYVVQAPAVHKYGSDLLDSINHMHFADGGYADGGYTGGLSGLGAWAGMQYQSLQSGFTAQMEALLEAAVAAGKAGGTSGRAPIIVNFNGTQMPTPEQSHALMTQLSAAVGVS